MVKHYLGIGVVGFLAALAACSGSSNSLSGDCTTLPTCCAQLADASSKTACENVVNAGNASTCASAQNDFVTANQCVMSSGGGGGGGGATSGCAGLAQCCGSLSGAEQQECDTYGTSAQGSNTTCGTYLSAYQAAGMCGSVGSGSGAGPTLSGCSGLMSCCSSLASADQGPCDEYVTISAGSDATCGTYLEIYTSAGMCGSSHSVAINTSGGGGTGCSGLSSCCSSVPSADQPSCTALVSEANDTACSEELTAYQSAGYCAGGSKGSSSGGGGGGGTGCSGLNSCCSSVPSADQPSCNEVVSEANDTACSEELTAYQSAGYCGGSSSGSSGGGSGSGGGCSSLSSCCSSVPSADQPSCNEVVSEANATACSEELTAYQSAGYCK